MFIRKRERLTIFAYAKFQETKEALTPSSCISKAAI